MYRMLTYVCALKGATGELIDGSPSTEDIPLIRSLGLLKGWFVSVMDYYYTHKHVCGVCHYTCVCLCVYVCDSVRVYVTVYVCLRACVCIGCVCACVYVLCVSVRAYMYCVCECARACVCAVSTIS